MSPHELTNNLHHGADHDGVPPLTTDLTMAESEQDEWEQWQEMTGNEQLFQIHRSFRAFATYAMDKLDLLEAQVKEIKQGQENLSSKCAATNAKHDEVTHNIAVIKKEIDDISYWLPQQKLPKEMGKALTQEVQRLFYTDPKCPVVAVTHNHTLIEYFAESDIATVEPRLKRYVDGLDNEELAGEFCSIARDAMGHCRKHVKGRLMSCDSDPRKAQKLASAPLFQWAKQVSGSTIRSRKWNDGKALQARYAKLRMFRDLPAHCGVNATGVPSARGNKKRKVTVAADGDGLQGEPLTAEELVAKATDTRFVCPDVEAAEGLLRVITTLQKTSEMYWDAYAKFVEWCEKRGLTDEAIVQADVSLYMSEPATPRSAGGAASSGASTGIGPGEADLGGEAAASVSVSTGMAGVIGGGGTMAVGGSAAAPDTPTPASRPNLGLWRPSAARRQLAGPGGPSSSGVGSVGGQ